MGPRLYVLGAMLPHMNNQFGYPHSRLEGGERRWGEGWVDIITALSPCPVTLPCCAVTLTCCPDLLTRLRRTHLYGWESEDAVEVARRQVRKCGNEM